MPADASNSPRLTTETLVFLIAVAGIVVHLATNIFGGYGYFRDELYYLACSRHLGWGYVDQPPLSIFLLAVSRSIFGESLMGLRLFPAVVSGATIFLAGLTSRELGGGRFAQTLAAVATLVSPIYLGMMSIYSMNSFDILFWALSAFLLIRIVKTQSPRLWLWLGLVLGLGLLNKIDILWLGFGIGVGLVLTPERRWLKTKWPWLAGAIALLLFLPYVLWNAANNFPHLEFIRNASSGKYSGLTPLGFIVDQFLPNNPFSFPIWIAGLWFYLIFSGGNRFRLLGWIYVAVFLVLIVNGHSKGEYLAPAYTMLFAGGAVWIEGLIIQKSLNWLRPVSLALLILSGALFAPLAIAVLPVETFIRYSQALGVAPSTPEHNRLDKLPQFYADMFGWEKLAAIVSGIYDDLSPAEKARCAVYTQNYGEAGAIDFYRSYLELPRVVSGHNSYFLWGPGPEVDSAVVIIIGGREEDHRRSFEIVEIAGRTNCDYCMPYENHLPIFICRGLRKPIQELWPNTKNFS